MVEMPELQNERAALLRDIALESPDGYNRAMRILFSEWGPDLSTADQHELDVYLQQFRWVPMGETGPETGRPMMQQAYTGGWLLRKGSQYYQGADRWGKRETAMAFSTQGVAAERAYAMQPYYHETIEEEPKTCPVSMIVQSVTFDRAFWKPERALDWALEHGYTGFLDETPNYWRLRVVDPERCWFMRWGKPLRYGLRFVYGCPRE